MVEKIWYFWLKITVERYVTLIQPLNVYWSIYPKIKFKYIILKLLIQAISSILLLLIIIIVVIIRNGEFRCCCDPYLNLPCRFGITELASLEDFVKQHIWSSIYKQFAIDEWISL